VSLALCTPRTGLALLVMFSMFLKQPMSGDTPGKPSTEPNKRKNNEPADDGQLSKKQKGARHTLIRLHTHARAALEHPGENRSVLLQGRIRASLKKEGKEGFSVLQYGTGGSETFARLLVPKAATNPELCEQQNRARRNREKEVYDLVPHNYKAERFWTFKDKDGASCRQVCLCLFVLPFLLQT
jgi:hypothetical protein